ncbi:MAG: DUF2505 domain-containing protein [Myxococcota bacterium]
MKFRVEHVFTNIALEAYESLYFDEDFNIALCNDVRLKRQLLSRDLDGDHLTRVVKVGADRELPPAAAKVLGANRIEYTEHLDYVFGRYRGTWKTVSSLMTNKVDTAGTFAFEEVPRGVRRLVEGEIKVKLFAVGSMIEKVIVADIDKSYNKAAEFTQRWIDQHNT